MISLNVNSVPKGNIKKITDTHRKTSTQKGDRKVYEIEIEQEPVIRHFNTETLREAKAQLQAEIDKIDSILSQMED